MNSLIHWWCTVDLGFGFRVIEFGSLNSRFTIWVNWIDLFGWILLLTSCGKASKILMNFKLAVLTLIGKSFIACSTKYER